jgi:flagellar hook-associated protein 1 FlgK
MGSDLLGIAVSGLKTSQAQISTTGHNITNANEEGYSRQRVDVGTNPALYAGSGYVGTGVHVQSIERIANEFLTSQIRLDTTAYNELDAFSQKVSEMDNLLSNEAIGLSDGLSNFFSALQAATDDPTSIPVRQLVLAQSEVLAQRFSSLYGRFEETNDIVNQELEATASMVTSLANGLAGLNKAIVNATAQGSGSAPNDLLDERDETLRQLSELVSVTTFEQADGAVNVFIGNGQPLVVGQVASELQAAKGETDPTRNDLVFVNEGSTQIVTGRITGGRLGGLLDYRSDVLDRSFNELGRVALAFTEAMNYQQSVGLDLNGNYGVPMFDDINLRQATLDRVVPSSLNGNPPDRVVSVSITDATALGNSDYTLSLSGTGPDAYELIRNSDGELVQSGGLSAQRPTSIEYEGFSISLEEGTFQEGDRYRIMPTRFASQNVNVVATSPEVLAFAAPVSTTNNLANSGTGKISQGEVLQTIDPLTGDRLPAFSVEGELSPPIMVKFTSATTYDVLDVSDPNNPKSLVPPFEGQTFIPGQTNQIFPTEPGQTVMVSDGFNANRIPSQSEVVFGSVGVNIPNTYLSEEITVTYTDPDTGIAVDQPNVVINPGASAEEIAFQLSSRDGVSAIASTETQIRIADNGPSDLEDFNLHLNGVNLRNELGLFYSPSAVPNPITNDMIADAINYSSALQQQNISAISNGDSITIKAATGADLKFEMQGAEGDFIEIKGEDKPTLMTTQVVTSGIDLSSSGLSRFDIDLFDGPNGLSNPKTIELSGTFQSPEELISYLENQIDIAFDVPGKVSVELREDGTLQFLNNDNGPLSKMQISNLVGSDPLGLSAAVQQGVVQPSDIVRLEGAYQYPTVTAGVNITNGADFSSGGPHRFEVDLNDGAFGANNPVTINLSGVYSDAQSVVNVVQTQLDAFYGSDKVVASVSPEGRLEITNYAYQADTSTGSLTISNNYSYTDGTAPGPLSYDQAVVDFEFDGALPLVVAPGANTFSISVNAAPVADITVPSGSYSSPAQFAAALNTAMGALDATATVSDDGRSVLVTADNLGEALIFGPGAVNPIQANPQNDLVTHVGRTAVITDPSAFIGLGIADDETIGLSVDGAGTLPVALDFDAPGYVNGPGNPPTSTAELVSLLNASFAASPAGSGVTAFEDGGQIIIASSNPLGSVLLTADSGGTPVAADSNMGIVGTVGTVPFPAATSGSAITSPFDVNHIGNFEDASGNPSPLTIIAGVNDSFEVSVDGGSTYTTYQIPAGTYTNLIGFAAAVDTATGSDVAVEVSGSSLLITDANAGVGSQVRLGDGTFAITGPDTASVERAQIQITNVQGSDPLGMQVAALQGIVRGEDFGMVNGVTISGEVNVTLEENFSMTTDAIDAGNVFRPGTEALSNYLGYTFDISGNPDVGDEFFVNFNTDGVSDNRNALKFVEVESMQLIGGNASFQESYSNLVEYVGTVTAESTINREAASEILEQSSALRNSIAGVNLDEEAANLIRYELSYNASSRIISVARDLFDTLLAAF